MNPSLSSNCLTAGAHKEAEMAAKTHMHRSEGDAPPAERQPARTRCSSSHCFTFFCIRTALLEPTDDAGIVSYTYAEFQAKVYAFTGYLQEQQFVKGQRLMVGTASRVDWMVVFLGTLLAGGVVVPLDISSKQDFIERIAQTTGATHLATTSKQYAALKNSSLPLIDLDNLPQGTLDAGALPEVTSDNLAELVFTSGTTQGGDAQPLEHCARCDGGARGGSNYAGRPHAISTSIKPYVRNDHRNRRVSCRGQHPVRKIACSRHTAQVAGYAGHHLYGAGAAGVVTLHERYRAAGAHAEESEAVGTAAPCRALAAFQLAAH